MVGVSNGGGAHEARPDPLAGGGEGAAEAIEAGLEGFLEEGLPTGIFQRGSLSPSRPVDPNSRDPHREAVAGG